MRTEQLRRELDLQLRWVVFPLHPETPDAGQSLERLFAGRLDITKMLLGLQQVANSLNLPFGLRTHTYNSRRAQELGKWAEQQGLGTPYREAIYRAYFADGRNIAEPSELAQIAESIGLSAQDAVAVLQEKRFAAEVDSDWQYGHSLGVSSVPSYQYAERWLTGFQEYAAYQQLIAG